MKLTAFAAIAATAALVSAVPLRVVVVSPGDAQELKPLSLRFGLPAAGATVAHPAMDKPVAYPAHARPCGGRFRQKSIEFSNALRKAFGFPTIEDHQVFPSASVASVKLNGVTTFIEGPEIMYAGKPGWRGKTKGGDRVHIIEWTPEGRPPPFPPHRGGPPPPFPPHRNGVPPPPPPHHGHYHHHSHSHHGPSGEPFLGRVQNALLSLGPWEGRVVAFVLGCGIGVLLRMVWVLGLIMVRSFRGTNETHHYVLVVEDDENNSRATPVSAPPAYVYPVDEKVAAEETDAKKAQPADN